MKKHQISEKNFELKILAVEKYYSRRISLEALYIKELSKKYNLMNV